MTGPGWNRSRRQSGRLRPVRPWSLTGSARRWVPPSILSATPRLIERKANDPRMARPSCPSPASTVEPSFVAPRRWTKVLERAFPSRADSTIPLLRCTKATYPEAAFRILAAREAMAHIVRQPHNRSVTAAGLIHSARKQRSGRCFDGPIPAVSICRTGAESQPAHGPEMRCKQWRRSSSLGPLSELPTAAQPLIHT